MKPELQKQTPEELKKQRDLAYKELEGVSGFSTLDKIKGTDEKFHSMTEIAEESNTKKAISNLTEQQQQQVSQIANTLIPLDNEGTLIFGTNAQDSLTKFSDTMLEKVKRTDVGDIGVELEKLMKQLKMVDPEELTKKPNLIERIFKKTKRKIDDILSRNETITQDVDKISNTLMMSKEVLVRDVGMLDGLYNENKKYFDDVSLYILAGEMKMEELETQVLEDLKSKADETNNQMDVQAVNDMMQYINRLEKRVHDLKLSRQITLQTAPQIRMVQDINQTLAEKIQSSVLTSIPLWKNQMAITLTLLRQEGASKAQQMVTSTTNDLLLKNSQLLKTNAIETAKENERGIVDIETLKTTQNNLVSTIEETLRIQQEGTSKRKQVDKELANMEEELKGKLLGMKDKYNV